MNQLAEADIVPLIRGLVQGLQPYALANRVQLRFETNCKAVFLSYQPDLLAQSIVKLLCQVIHFIPHESKVRVQLRMTTVQEHLLLQVENTGINLDDVSKALENAGTEFAIQSLEKGTLFSLQLPLRIKNERTTVGENSARSCPLPQFYAEIRKRLQSHFSQAEKLVAALAQTRPREAAFLQKINALIQANLADENFDTSALCKAMAMSRTQLFRRLKPLIRQAPALYLKKMRLEKAKELLETTDCTVSEVAFKTGFQNLSHFTKLFQRHYGVLPSVFRRSRKPATNQ